MAKKSTRTDEIVGFRVSQEKKRLLEESAKSQGLTMTQLVDQALSLRLAMSAGFWEQIEKAAWEFQIPVSTIIINGVLKKIAFEAAWLKIFGQSAPSAVAEFRFSDKGLVKGDELFQQLLGEFETSLREAKATLEKGAKDKKGVYLRPAEMESILRGIRPCQAQ